MASLEANGCYEYEEKGHSLFEASFENKTKYEFPNKKAQYIGSKQQLDGCLVKNMKSCDWLFSFKRDNNKGVDTLLVFVELKDSDLINAIDQIESSIKHWGGVKKGFSIHARIVLTKTYSPDINDNRVLKFKKIIELAGGTVVYKSQKLVENIIN